MERVVRLYCRGAVKGIRSTLKSRSSITKGVVDFE